MFLVGRRGMSLLEWGFGMLMLLGDGCRGFQCLHITNGVFNFSKLFSDFSPYELIFLRPYGVSVNNSVLSGWILDNPS